MLASRLTSRSRILVGFHYAADRLTCKWKRDEKGRAFGSTMASRSVVESLTVRMTC